MPSVARVAAGAFGFLIFSHAFDGPDLYGESSFFDTMPSRPSLQRPEHFGAISLCMFDVLNTAHGCGSGLCATSPCAPEYGFCEVFAVARSKSNARGGRVFRGYERLELTSVIEPNHFGINNCTSP